MRFTPTKSFFDEDLQSHYLEGLFYTLQPGHDVLAAKVSAWLAEGKIRMAIDGGERSNPSLVSGAGVVR
jgi:hypothetical protein